MVVGAGPCAADAAMVKTGVAQRTIASSAAEICAGGISNSLSRTVPEHEGRNMAVDAATRAQRHKWPDEPIVPPHYCLHLRGVPIRFAAGTRGALTAPRRPLLR